MLDFFRLSREVSDMSRYQRGFTLVELIVVIVILGILAATALPRFVNLGGDARAATMQGIAASMEAAKQLVQARWLVAGSATNPNVDIGGGTTVTVLTGLTGVNSVRNGWPTEDAAGMVAAIITPSAVSCVAGADLVCTYTGFPTCTVTYNDDSNTLSVVVGASGTTC